MRSSTSVGVHLIARGEPGKALSCMRERNMVQRMAWAAVPALTLELLWKGPGGEADSRPRRGPGRVGANRGRGHYHALPRPLLR